jgi:hypothetical protein
MYLLKMYNTFEPYKFSKPIVRNDNSCFNSFKPHYEDFIFDWTKIISLSLKVLKYYKKS